MSNILYTAVKSIQAHI